MKLVDFGIAKAAIKASHTDSGSLRGKLLYMSPEQGEGDAKDIDHRSDIFSLGILLYEMATARRPFQGRSSAELASAILRDAPPALEESRPDLPDGLRRIVSRCLQKEPDNRFPTAREAAVALRDLRSGPSSLTPPLTRAESPATSPAPPTPKRRDASTRRCRPASDRLHA